MKTTGYWGNSTLRSPITDPIWSRASLKPLAAQFHKLWGALITAMTASEELQVWQTQRRDGTALWHVYDPLDGRRLQFASEGDVRQWLEARYYVR